MHFYSSRTPKQLSCKKLRFKKKKFLRYPHIENKYVNVCICARDYTTMGRGGGEGRGGGRKVDNENTEKQPETLHKDRRRKQGGGEEDKRRS